MQKLKRAVSRFLICVENKGYAVSLEKRKRETVPTSKTLNIVVTIGERSRLSPQNMTMLFTASQRHTVRGDGKVVLFGVS